MNACGLVLVEESPWRAGTHPDHRGGPSTSRRNCLTIGRLIIAWHLSTIMYSAGPAMLNLLQSHRPRGLLEGEGGQGNAAPTLQADVTWAQGDDNLFSDFLALVPSRAR
ncbi:hypothetical protein PGTUg99_018449 [Puccinia graminis f. sp. tritici]|uniref:Uncharacterized protein n=1 Tax=Puccinia graminis f. sp. tritici TaxID=56615 RepID=A0A5B0Q1C3_PUCGR|nr:hypothetical protein PGTUg99_018449 [Puccinia graminis f. sp. tritici]